MHIAQNPGQKYEPVPEAWLLATANATEYAIEVSGVRNIAVKVAPGFAEAAGTAQFNPQTRVIEVDTNVMLPGVRADDVKLKDPLFSARYPLFKGALLHEAAHARYSRWVGNDLVEDGRYTKQMIDVLTLLEESRIEKRMRNRKATDAQQYLPSLVFDLIGRDFKLSDSPYGAAASAALILARVDAGTITVTDAKPFRKIILEVLSEEQLAELEKLWREYHALRFNQYEDLPHEQMISIAKRWLAAVGIDADAEPEEGAGEPELCAGGSGSGEGEEGEESEESGSGGSFSERVREAAAGAKHDQDQKHAERVGKIKVERKLQEREADAERHKAGEREEKKAFEGERVEVEPGHGYGIVSDSMYSERVPTGHEVGAAGIFAKRIERVLYTDRKLTKINTEVPGGRLRGRAAMAGDAARAQGQHDVRVAPWRKKKITVTDEPTVRVGLMVDISGSMTAAAKPMGSMAYILGNGVNRADGIFASVVFGAKVYGVVKPGQKITTVPVVDPSDGFEAFKPAFLALDSALDLLDGEGLKILVLATDGHLVDPEHAKYADTAIRLCEKRGVLVLHLDFSGVDQVAKGDARYNLRHGNKTMPLNIPVGTPPAQVADLIGQRVLAEAAKLQAKRGGAAA
jgi:hypothetical protein